MDVKIAIKTGVVAGLAWLIGEWFAVYTGRPESLLSGLWCVVAAIVVVQENLGSSYKMALARFTGIGIGSLTGGFFTVMMGATPVSLAVGVALTIILCSLFKLKDSYRIASLSVAIVMVSWAFKPQNSPWTYSLYRFEDSVLGIIIAMIIVHLLWPEQATSKMRYSLANALDKLKMLYQQSVVVDKSDTTLRPLVNDIEDLLIKSRAFFEDAKMELVTKTSNVELWSDLLEQLQSLLDSIISLRTVYDKNVFELFDQDLVQQLERLIRQTEAAFRKLSAMLIAPQENVEALDLKESLEKLKDELIRFRSVSPTRHFPFPDVQNFFVFFYSLKIIVEDLRKIEKRIEELNSL